MSNTKSKINGWTCKKCFLNFRTRNLLGEHNKTHHPHKPHDTSSFVTITKNLYTCSFCKKEFFTIKSGISIHEKFCNSNPNKVLNKRIGSIVSVETREKLRQNAGGYRKEAGRGIRGYYKGLYCMSTWELAWVVYHLDQGEKVEQCKEYFHYEMNSKIHKYYPDFIINKTYYEIKNWHRPDTDFKINQFPKEKTLVLIEGKKENKKYLEYVIQKYGKEFWKVLYEN